MTINIRAALYTILTIIAFAAIILTEVFLTKGALLFFSFLTIFGITTICVIYFEYQKWLRTKERKQNGTPIQ